MKADASADQEAIQAASWQTTIYRHSKDLKRLPIPPKAFIRTQRENPLKSSSKRKADTPAKQLKRLIRGEQERYIDCKPKQCKPWAFRPKSLQQPEPNPGVPTITITKPNGKTGWLQDTNSYLDEADLVFVQMKAARDHNQPDNKEHCAAHAEAWAKGLQLLPHGRRPKVLYCFKCNEQAV